MGTVGTISPVLSDPPSSSSNSGPASRCASPSPPSSVSTRAPGQSQEVDDLSDEEVVVNSIRLQYPKSSRLLLGTTTNIQQPGFLKALETRYPLELSLECFDLNPGYRILPRLTGRPRGDRRWLLRPFAVFFYRNDESETSWELIGRTETILYDDYHRFVTKLKVCCATMEDRRKELRIEVYDRRTKSDDIDQHTFIGATQCVLDDIISEPLLRKELNLDSCRVSDPGRVIISADAIRPSLGVQKLSLSVDLASCCFANLTKSQYYRVFYVLSRQLQSGDYTAVYRSEIVTRDGGRKFHPITRDVSAITAGVDDKLLRLELFQFNHRGPHTRLGFVQTSVDKLMKTTRGSRLLWWPSASSDDVDIIDINRVILLDSSAENGHVKFRLRVTQ